VGLDLLEAHDDGRSRFVSIAFVLMTAMPPTKGHLHLIQFATHVADEVCVIVGTQPGEPYVRERVKAIESAARKLGNIRVVNIHQTLPQTPAAAPDFWEMWRKFLVAAGCRGEGDFIVASERYGIQLAAVTGSRFIPYDYDRGVDPSRATRIRHDPLGHFVDVMIEFQPTIRQRVTIFGAESTGKTKLSRALADRLGGHWLPEWARPYLEHLDTVAIDDDRMRDIWIGQRALQTQGQHLVDRPFIVQDTDLFSTVGYWEQWHPGETPPRLVEDASADRSDLYLLARSNIPFEPDPQRFGIDRRETSDSFWSDLAESHGLNCEILSESDPERRVNEAAELAVGHFNKSVHLAFERIDNE
jgi:HTH-type transcriptional repressor of NAD biosynthesis genes